MSKEEIRVPDLGGSDEVEVIEVSVQVGDTVAAEDPILVVESDKATVDLPSPMGGTIRELKVAVGDKIKEGDLVGMIDTEGEESSAEDASGKDPADSDVADQPGETESESRGTNEAEDKPAKAEAPEKAAKTSKQETVKVPDIGGSKDVPIIEIQVKEGDTVAVDDPLVTLESDKASMEVPSPFAGKIGKLLVKVEDTVSEGDALLEMSVESDEGNAGDEDQPETENRKEEPPKKKPTQSVDEKARPETEADSSEPEETAAAGARVHAGPAVRKVARELGVNLPQVKGSGPKQRILKEDVQSYVKQQLKQTQGGVATGTGGGIPGVKLPDFSQFGEVKRRAMSRMHSLTADSMQRSWLNVPHVTQFEDADITDLEAFRKSQKAAGEKQGIKITPLPFILKACAYALREQPVFNVSLDMDKREVIEKHYIHIGIAVDTPNGLVVPVIRDVDKKGIWELASEAQDLAAKARDKKLKPAEMQGACFTITSLGGIGGTAFTPIVNSPEVAILGVSKASMKPVWEGDGFVPRLMLPLSLSYDHRAINGAEAARFTTLLKRLLEDMRELMM
ncbi:MAG: dihydrolipoyllysine-residue acetyltransferase [Alteromonadaceae bacterium]|nr:dihydrolipoyllysine-residue acetyltransferase [Alteromonadaceae bacterium]|tara:strand:- start:89 stop:1783 length:1695 start_codon:yes stop_codon:yes gene_type:complete